MNLSRNCLKLSLLGAVLALCVTVTPVFSQVPVQAPGIIFYNNTDKPILVQGTTTVNGMVVRGPQMIINPGKSAFDPSIPKGWRHVCVHDAMLVNVKLLEAKVLFGGVTAHVAIQPKVGNNPANPWNFELAPKKVIPK